MNQAPVHIASPVASHTCTSGNSIEQLSKQQRDRIRIKELLKDRLNKLGPIRTMEVWHICKHEFVYGTLADHFRHIMLQMRTNGKADFIRHGLWFIHKQDKK